MNYYKRHIGDYAKKAGHLSVLEHGVYTLLLDAYYDREQPPTRAEAVRIARCRSDVELAALDAVLSDFFHEVDGRYVQDRVEEEFKKAEAQARANQANGVKGGRPRKPKGAEKETHSVSAGNPKESEKNPNPLIHQSTNSNQELKATVQPAAAPRSTALHFDRFWAAYPNKKGKKDAERHWRREGCDEVADALIAHVRLMMTQDDGWRRGYAPMGSTYLNGRRWEDIPLGPPKDRLSKSAQAMIALEGLKDGMDGSGSENRFPEIDLPRIGSTARLGTFGGNGNGMG